MKILVISQYYTPDITAAAFRISETVAHLRSYGNDVKVVTTFPHKNDVKEEFESEQNNIYRVYLPDSENKGFAGYLYSYVSFLAKSIFKGYKVGRIQKPDIIWATSPPIFVGLAGWMLANLLNADFALDIRDIWPDSAVAAGQISNSGFAYKIGRWLERFLYLQVDLITCVATPMKKYIQQYTNASIEVIYNGVELSSLQQKGTSNFEYSILNKWATKKNAKKILYAGNLGHVQQLDILIKAYDEIDNCQLNEEWEIFFLGGGAKKELLVELTDAKGLSEQIHFLDPVPKGKIFNYLSSADVLFIHLMNAEVLKLTIPSKVFDYMVTDRPLLAGISGEGKEVINSVPGNFTFKSGNKESLKKTFQRLDQVYSNNQMPDNFSAVKKFYSRENQSKKLNKIFKIPLR